MSGDVMDADDARVALNAAAVSRRRLLERASPVSLMTQLCAAPVLVAAAASADAPLSSDWWPAVYVVAAAVSVVSVVVDRRRNVRLSWSAAGPAGWLIPFVAVMGYIGAWYPTAAALRATSVPMPHTWAAVAVLGLIFATRPALDRAFRWLALRRDVG